MEKVWRQKCAITPYYIAPTRKQRETGRESKHRLLFFFKDIVVGDWPHKGRQSHEGQPGPRGVLAGDQRLWRFPQASISLLRSWRVTLAGRRPSWVRDRQILHTEKV